MKPKALAVSASCLPLAGLLLLAGCNSKPSPSDPPAPPGGAPSGGTTKTEGTKTTMPAPERKPPAGMGNAIGQVLFDGKPAANIEVQLCQEISTVFGGCTGTTYSGKTDKDGFYIIDKVKPGEYSLRARVFTTNYYIYHTSGILSAAKLKVEADQSTPVGTMNLWKSDIVVLSPKNGETVKSGKPKFAWKAYPSAANYKVTIRTKEGNSNSFGTSSTSGSPDTALLNGDYKWNIEATNAEGTKLAALAEDISFKVTGQVGSTTVDLLNPKASATVAGAGLKLQWKAHPLASEYRVYLKGNKAADPVLTYQTMPGTSYAVPSTLPADQYYWSVQAMKDGEKVAESPLTMFNVK